MEGKDFTPEERYDTYKLQCDEFIADQVVLKGEVYRELFEGETSLVYRERFDEIEHVVLTSILLEEVKNNLPAAASTSTTASTGESPTSKS